jgi:hypothetical protein
MYLEREKGREKERCENACHIALINIVTLIFMF